MRQSRPWFLLFAMILLLSGCLGRGKSDVTYYTLLNMNELGETQAVASFPDVKLGVGPITIADSLKRNQIATRENGYQFKFNEFQRWAGVLEKDLSFVLGDNLGTLLGTEMVTFFPWTHGKPDYRIVVDVARLDGTLGGEAVFVARWGVAGKDLEVTLAAGKSEYRIDLADTSYDTLVKAESQLLVKLSQEIAAEIVKLKK